LREFIAISFGLQYNQSGSGSGAQTERPGLAVAGESFAWPQDLTGRTYPIPIC
jgi:hypothetical protein